MSDRDLTSLSTDELLRRRGELAQGMQHLALEGLPQDDDDVRAVAELDAELERRRVDPRSPTSGARAR